MLRAESSLGDRSLWPDTRHLFGSKRAFYQTGPYYNRDACHVGTAAGGAPKFGGNYWVDYDDAKWINSVSDRGNDIISGQVDIAKRRLRAMGLSTTIVFAPVANAFARERAEV
jgi:hypothetical protein